MSLSWSGRISIVLCGWNECLPLLRWTVSISALFIVVRLLIFPIHALCVVVISQELVPIFRVDPANQKYFHVIFDSVDLRIIEAGLLSKLLATGHFNPDSPFREFLSLENNWLV